MRAQLTADARGYSLVEILLVLALSTTIAGLTIPAWQTTMDHLRTASAARHAAAQIADARLEALRRSSMVALRFDPDGADYRFQRFLDGNGNGLRTLDVSRGIDAPVGPAEKLGDRFPGVTFGLAPGIPDLDGASGNGDGVRIGATPFLSLSPTGSATGGTLYVRGRRGQYAVRIVGATARARFYQFDYGARRWIAR